MYKLRNTFEIQENLTDLIDILNFVSIPDSDNENSKKILYEITILILFYYIYAGF